jgi:hypothetical protein
MENWQRKFRQWLWGAKSPFAKIVRRDGKKPFALVDGIIDLYTWNDKPQHRPNAHINRILNSTTTMDSIWRAKQKLVTRHYEGHLNKKMTLYYTGSMQEDSEHLLCGIDLDAHDLPPLEAQKDTQRLAKWVNETFFNGKAYFEPSTSGNGVHMYFVLHHSLAYKQQVNKIVKAFADHLKAQSKERAFVAKVCSINGNYPIVGLDYDECVQLKGRKLLYGGALIKLPRPSGENDVEWLVNAPVIEITELMSECQYYSNSENNSKKDLKDTTKGSASLFATAKSSLTQQQQNNNTPSFSPPSSPIPSSPPPSSPFLYTCVHNAHSQKKVWEYSEEEIRANDNAYERYLWTVLKLSRSLNRVCSLEEAMDYYRTLKLNRGDGNIEKRRKKFVQIIARCHTDFDPSKAGEGYRREDFKFIDGLFTQELVSELRAEKAFSYRRSITTEDLAVFQYVVRRHCFDLRDQTDWQDTCPQCSIIGMFRLLKERGKVKHGCNSGKAYALKVIAERLGLIEWDRNYVWTGNKKTGKGQKIVIGKNDPRYAEYRAWNQSKPTKEAVA